MMKDPAISIEDLHVSYFGNEAVTGVSLTVNTGNLVGIIGPNGAGKSTFLKAMLNLIPKDKGAVRVMGKSIAEVRKSIAYVPQRNDIDWDFPITVHDAVLIGTYPHLKLFRRPRKRIKSGPWNVFSELACRSSAKGRLGNYQAASSREFFLREHLLKKRICSFWMSHLLE